MPHVLPQAYARRSGAPLAVIEFNGYAGKHPFEPSFSLWTVDFWTFDPNGKLLVNLVGVLRFATSESFPRPCLQ